MTYYDLQQFLKKFGTIIYTGDRLSDLDLMEVEIRELYRLGIIENDFLKETLMAIYKEREAEKRKREEKEKKG